MVIGGPIAKAVKVLIVQCIALYTAGLDQRYRGEKTGGGRLGS